MNKNMTRTKRLDFIQSVQLPVVVCITLLLLLISDMSKTTTCALTNVVRFTKNRLVVRNHRNTFNVCEQNTNINVEPLSLRSMSTSSIRFSSSLVYTNTGITLSSSTIKSVEGDFDPDAIERSKQAIQSGSLVARMNVLYKFTRPHTIRGTILASIAGTVRALLDTPNNPLFGGGTSSFTWIQLIPRALIGMVALLFGNAFIVGINQIYDKDIDMLNKPFLPVASGEMSKRYAWVAVVSSAVIGPLLVYNHFPKLLFQLYSTGLVLGLLYSVPPTRTKRNPILAALTIACVRGFLLNFGVYYAVKDALSVPFSWSPKVAFIARFMTLFATVIAITKDLPDVEGDKAYQIETFATKIGVGRMAKGAAVCLLLNYIHAIGTCLLSKIGTFNRIPMIGGHFALAIMVLYRARQLKPESMSSIKLYYKHIWDLFYLEYVLYTLI